MGAGSAYLSCLYKLGLANRLESNVPHPAYMNCSYLHGVLPPPPALALPALQAMATMHGRHAWVRYLTNRLLCRYFQRSMAYPNLNLRIHKWFYSPVSVIMNAWWRALSHILVSMGFLKKYHAMAKWNYKHEHPAAAAAVTRASS